MKLVDILAWLLLIIGGLNWGLIGALDLDLVARFFGPGSFLSRIIYILFGLSALYQLFQWRGIRDRWRR
jgi:uncharacterized membrane protein YuzA (DUF378 family)